MFADPRTEWRINDVERKADECARRIYEIDEAKRAVCSLEHSLLEARSCIDGLRYTVEACAARIEALECKESAQ